MMDVVLVLMWLENFGNLFGVGVLHKAPINHLDKTIAEHVKQISILLNKHIRLADNIISEI